MPASSPHSARDLFSYRKYWAKRYGIAPFLPMSRAEMDTLGWDSCDIIIVPGDAYAPHDTTGKRPDRTETNYSLRAREAYKDVPILIGGIEASPRRIAHYDYWSDTVRRSVLLDAKADLLVYGNAERQIVDIAHRLAAGEAITDITDVRGTTFVRRGGLPDGWAEIDSADIAMPGRLDRPDA